MWEEKIRIYGTPRVPNNFSINRSSIHINVLI